MSEDTTSEGTQPTIDETLAHVDERLDGLQKSLVHRWLAVLVVLVVMGFFTYSNESGQSDNADKAKQLVFSTHRLALQNQALTLAIQRERYDSAFNSCWTAAQRHDKTVDKINSEVDAAVKKGLIPPGAAATQKAQTKAIIDDLTPNLTPCGPKAAKVINAPA